MDDENLYEQANKKIKIKKGFFYHLLAYVFTIGMLYAIMYFENGGELLPVIIVGLSWGIGLAAHYLYAFGTENLEILGLSSDWEEDELEKELERLKRKRELKEEIRKEKASLDKAERLELKEIVKNPLEGNGYD